MPVMTCPVCGYLIVNSSQPCPSCNAVISASATQLQNLEKTEASRMYANNSSGSPERLLAAVDKKLLIVSICQITAVLFFILSLIGGFMMKVNLLYVGLGSFLTCLFIYVMGEIVNQLAIANYNAGISYLNIKQQNEKIIILLASNKQPE